MHIKKLGFKYLSSEKQQDVNYQYQTKGMKQIQNQEMR